MQKDKGQSNLTSLLLIGLLFAIFGIISWLNGTLIQFLKTACELTERQATLVTFAFFISYTVMALPSSALLRWTGFKNGMGLGLVAMAAGCLLFVPAANSRNYVLFLVGLFTQGLGLTILQTASNPYVTIVGPIESAAKRISIMGICNKLAGALGSILFGAILLSNMTSINEQLAANISPAQKESLLAELSQKIIAPYIGLAIFLLLVAVLIRFSPLPDVRDSEDAEIGAGSGAQRPLSAHVYLFLGALAIFAYVGVEVLAGDYIVRLGDYLDVPDDNVKYLTSLTLFFMLGGYALGVALIPKVISQERALVLNVIGGLVFSTLLLFTSGMTAVFCLAFLGFFHAVMWPAIWPMSIRGLGRFTKIGSALLIMGIAGGAVLPYVWGSLADLSGGNVQQAFWIMIPCYLYILFFALKGHKIGYRPTPANAQNEGQKVGVEPL